MSHYDGYLPKVDVSRELLKLDYVVGEDTKQFKVEREFTLPRPVRRFLTPDITIPQDKIKTEVIEDKVIVEGELIKQVYYVGEDGVVYEETLPPEKWTEFIDIPGASPGDHAQVRVRPEDVRFEIIEQGKKFRGEEGDDEVDAQFKPPRPPKPPKPPVRTRVKQIAIVELFVKVTETVQVEVVTDIVGKKIQAFKELVKVQNVIGEGTVQTTVISDVDFDEPVKKIMTVDSAFKDITSRVIEDKVIVDGVLHKQIYYVEDQTGIVRERTVEDSFTQFLDVPGARPGMNVQVYPRVEFIDHVINNNNRRLVKQTAVIELFIKVTETVQIEVVVGATGVDVFTELFKVENVVGEDTDQVKVTADITFPEPAKKVANIVANAVINEVTPIEDKVIIKGELEKQVFYVDEATNILRELTVEPEPFTHFIHIPGTRPGMNVQVTPRIEFVNIDLAEDGLTGRQVAVIELFAKVTETEQIEVVTDVNIPDKDFKKPDASYVIYVVQPCDSLFKIAKRFGVRLDDLIAANPQIEDPNLIFPGQKIVVPVMDNNDW